MAKKNEFKPKVMHIMADGEIRDSIEGCVVPADNPVYEILRQLRREDKEVFELRRHVK